MKDSWLLHQCCKWNANGFVSQTYCRTWMKLKNIGILILLGNLVMTLFDLCSWSSCVHCVALILQISVKTQKGPNDSCLSSQGNGYQITCKINYSQQKMVVSSASRWLDPSSDHLITYRLFILCTFSGDDLIQNSVRKAFGFSLM